MSSRRVGIRLFLAFALLYILTAHGRPFSDDMFLFEQIGVFVETGEFVMSPDRDPEALGGAGAFMRPGQDGRVYLTLPPGLPLAGAPLGLLGRALGGPNPEPGYPIDHAAPPGVAFWAALTVPIVVAGAIGAFFWLVERQTRSLQRGLEAAVVLGLATNTWFFATTFWTQPLAAACCLAALMLVVGKPDQVGSSLLASVCLGYAIVTRFELVLLIPWYLGLVGRGEPQRIRRMIMFSVPLVVVGLGLAAWNEFRFGDPLETRSLHQRPGNVHPRFLPTALPNMLFGFDEGLFLYSPAVMLGIVAIPRAWKTNRSLTLCLLGMVGTMLLFYGSFVFWSTPPPISWGPRFLYPAVPLLLLLAFLDPEYDPLNAGWARAVVVVSSVVSVIGVVQRVRVGPPVWWADDPVRASVAAGLALILILLVARLGRATRESQPWHTRQCGP